MARLRVRVRPAAGREGLVGWHADGALKIEVAAPPEGGRANEAVVRLLATILDVPRSEVRIAGGHASRSKRIEIGGLSEQDVKTRLHEAVERQDGKRGK